MRRTILAAVAALTATGAAAEPTALVVDSPTVVNGVEVVCTGIGQTRDDPRWRAYGVRVEVSNALNEYLVGAAVTVGRHNEVVLSVSCDAPWVLLKLPAGDYSVEAHLPGSPARPRSARFHPPAEGQMRVVLQFPDA